MRKKEIKLTQIRKIEKIGDSFYLKLDKDAQVLSRTMLTMKNPSLIEDIEKIGGKSPYFELFELINLTIIDSDSGGAIYQFGTLKKELGIDVDMLGSFVLALSSMFYTESKYPFDSYTMESVNFDHNKSIYFFKYTSFILFFIWNKEYSKESKGKTFEDAKKLIQEYAKKALSKELIK